LLSILAESEKSGGEEGNKPDGLPRVEERPMLHLGKVVGEQEEAEEIGDEDEAGMALERGIGTGERNFSEMDQQGLHKDDDASDQDGGVKESSGPSPEK